MLVLWNSPEMEVSFRANWTVRLQAGRASGSERDIGSVEEGPLVRHKLYLVRPVGLGQPSDVMDKLDR